MAANFPDSPNTGDEFTHNSFTYTWNGDVWKLNPSSGVKGQKGQSGVDGTKGDKGQKGEKGEVGEKGQKGEKGIDGGTGSTGSTGDKGQKGEVGEKGIAGADGSKGQKGEVGEKGATGGTGSTGSTGDKGQKGQKGEVGATGGSGSAGVKGDKGQKGEVGATGSGGATGTKGSSGEKGDKGAPSTVSGDKGQKGEVGATGSGGTAGSTGAKGQKGEEGPQGGGAPVGQIVAWSGSASSLPSGYFLCDGSAISRTTYAALFTVVGTTHGSGNGSSTFNIPDLRDRFIVGASNSTGDTSYPGVSPSATGGSADAILVSHTHNLQNHVHGVNLTSNNPGDHDHNVDVLAEFASTHGTWQTGGGYRQVHTGGTHRKPITSDAGGHTHTVSGNTGASVPNTTDTLGESATNKNLPPYYALAYIIQYAQGGTTAKGQKGEQGATGSSGSGGSKGQKGEVGEKGAASSVQGPTGDKGQKGEVGATGGTGGTGTTGAKGQKGEIGSDGQKGSTGNAGADGDGGGLFPIEAERSSSVSTNEYYAIGNGANTSQGMRIPIASSLQYMTLRASSNVTITVELYVNGSASGKTVSLSSSSSATADFTSSPLSINADDYIAFRSLNNASATTVVAGWFGHDGVKGQTGTTGDKGQKGEIGADGGSGSDGSKGQKGATGATGGTGTAGSKGQKGEVGAQGSGGSTGSDGDKGQKGEIGATGGTGGSGQKGQKGEAGATGAKGQKGQKGEVGEKGQKGEIGIGEKGQKGEIGAGAPVGQIVAWSGSANSLPTGYFLCDGSAISRTTYADLYAIIGTTHGAGNGSTTFNLPDLRGKFVVGHHPSNGDYDVADTGGAESVTLTTAQMPSHKHDTTVDGTKLFPAAGGTTFNYGGAGQYPGTVFTMSNTGGGQAHENRPPYYALAYIIHYAQGGDAAKGQKGEIGGAGFKKVRTAVNTGTLSGNYGSYTNVLNIPSFTPNSTNSVFLITITIGNFYRSSGSGTATGVMRVNDNGTQVDGVDHTKNTSQHAGSHTFSIIDTRGGTGARNYGIQLARGNNNGVASITYASIMCIEMDPTA